MYLAVEIRRGVVRCGVVSVLVHRQVVWWGVWAWMRMTTACQYRLLLEAAVLLAGEEGTQTALGDALLWRQPIRRDVTSARLLTTVCV